MTVTEEFSEDKKTVTLTKSSGSFSAGEYTVAVSNVEGMEDYSTTLEIEAQTVASVEITSDAAVKAANGQSATFSYKVEDQYGTDITKTTTLEKSASNGVAVSLNKGVGTLTYDFTATNAPTSVVVTLVEGKTGIVASKTLEIAAAAKVDAFGFGDVVYPKDTSMLFVQKAEAGKIEVFAEDQYGNAITDPTMLASALQLVSSDSNVAFTFVEDTDAEQAYIKIDSASLTTDKTVTLTVVNKNTGVTATHNFEFEKPAYPTEITFGELNSEVVADGDTVYMDITVTDQFGNVMSDKDVAALSVSDLKLSATAGLQDNLSIVTDKTSEHYGELQLDPDATGNATIVSTLGDKSTSVNIDVKAARTLTEVVAGKDMTLIQGASAELPFTFKDQYGKDIETVVDTADLAYQITITDVTGTETVTLASLNTNKTLTEADLNSIIVDAASSKTGKAKVKVELLDTSDNDEVVSSAELAVSVVANDAEGLTYSIKDIPTLYSSTAGDTAVDGSSWYAAPLTIVATDANGNEYTVPASQILSTTSENGYLDISATAAADDAVVERQQNSLVVGALDADGADPAVKTDDAIAWGTATSVTDTVEVTLNTNSGVKVLSKDVTISKAAPKAQEVKIVNKDLAAGNHYALATGTLELTDTLEFADRAAAQAGITAYVVEKDQYGVWTTNTYQGASVITNTVGLVDANVDADTGFEFAGGKFILDEEVSGTIGYTAGATLRFSFIEDGITKTVAVKIAAEEPVTVTTAGATGTIANGGTETVEFSEALNTASKAAVEKALVDAITVNGAATYTLSWNVGNTVVTITEDGPTAVGNTLTLASATATIADVYGNKTTNAVLVTP